VNESLPEKYWTINLRHPRLQIGCSNFELCPHLGWLNADVEDTVTTHFVGFTHNYSMIHNHTVGTIYSSHTIEHLSSSQCPLDSMGPNCLSELNATMIEWRRILQDGGVLMISVPDFEYLATEFLNPHQPMEHKQILTTMIFGGHKTLYDYHKNGFDYHKLSMILMQYGFCDIIRVDDFLMFHDASATTFRNHKISLNVYATAC
jgi:predicted SAM-dependent methyltransferase